MESGVEEMKEFSGFRSAIPEATDGHPFTVFTSGRIPFFVVTGSTFPLSKLCLQLVSELAPLFLMEDRNCRFGSELVSEETAHGRTVLICCAFCNIRGFRVTPLPCVDSHVSKESTKQNIPKLEDLFLGGLLWDTVVRNGVGFDNIYTELGAVLVCLEEEVEMSQGTGLFVGA